MRSGYLPWQTDFSFVLRVKQPKLGRPSAKWLEFLFPGQRFLPCAWRRSLGKSLFACRKKRPASHRDNFAAGTQEAIFQTSTLEDVGEFLLHIARQRALRWGISTKPNFEAN